MVGKMKVAKVASTDLDDDTHQALPVVIVAMWSTKPRLL
jgi:hypothetical protein